MGEKQVFVDISIVNTQETSLSSRDILTIIKDRVEKTKELTTKWVEMDRNLVLRFIFPSLKHYTLFFQRGYAFLDVLIKILSEDQIDSFFQESSEETTSHNDQMYLVLKYQTQYKDPLRAKYEYNKWFEEKFREQIYIEEITDGFLHFYKRKIDFVNVNLDVLVPEELDQWIKNKKLNVPPSLIKQIFSQFTQKK